MKRFEDKCKERMMMLEKAIMTCQSKMKKWKQKIETTLTGVSNA